MWFCIPSKFGRGILVDDRVEVTRVLAGRIGMFKQSKKIVIGALEVTLIGDEVLVNFHYASGFRTSSYAII